ncbi:ArfGap-domain-containing protein [Punctularia strigosozonata HHB-11173 SS5]|uniref:ArfGap-domain-containing protein n=1 Tax=Punctularia strigosozonata (strain HHB-11173) TaxID=741275 RepID=UPI0004416802|nr:ArfGap-domain-containing protein [Punctularia strigosozonata HHB-11173 SS5]EIN14452.1 ArfGap-domain-containing protein [Punctularia strigosozonata HHB-11173 SS5]
MSSGMNKITAERNQKAVLELVNQPGNTTCADCHAHNPRWASWNLGIFICVHCAAVHRKIGTHITKVKSLTLDSWTKEQVETMRSIGNIASNNKYNPDETRFPPPANMIDSERDSELEKYIRAKYEFKRFMARQTRVEQVLGPSRSVADFKRDQQSKSTLPAINSPSTASVSAPYRPTSAAPTMAQSASASSSYSSQISRSVSQPTNRPSTQQTPTQQQAATSGNSPLWNDLASLQAPSTSSTLPLQFSPVPTQPIGIPNSTNTLQPMDMGASPFGSALTIGNMGYGTGAGPTMTSNSGNMGMGTSFGMLGTSPAMMNSASTSTPVPGSSPYGAGGFGTTNPFQHMQPQATGLAPGLYNGTHNPFGQQNPLGQQFQPSQMAGSFHGQNPFMQFPQMQQPQASLLSPQPQQQSSPFIPGQVPHGLMPQQQFAASPSPSNPYAPPLAQQFGTPSPSIAFGQPSGLNPNSVPHGAGMGSWQSTQQLHQPGGFAGQTGAWGSM